MNAQALYREFNIAEVFSHAWNAGRLTSWQQQGLMSALSDKSLNPEEQHTIDRILHAVRRGWIQVID